MKRSQSQVQLDTRNNTFYQSYFGKTDHLLQQQIQKKQNSPTVVSFNMDQTYHPHPHHHHHSRSPSGSSTPIMSSSSSHSSPRQLQSPPPSHLFASHTNNSNNNSSNNSSEGNDDDDDDGENGGDRRMSVEYDHHGELSSFVDHFNSNNNSNQSSHKNDSDDSDSDSDNDNFHHFNKTSSHQINNNNNNNNNNSNDGQYQSYYSSSYSPRPTFNNTNSNSNNPTLIIPNHNHTNNNMNNNNSNNNSSSNNLMTSLNTTIPSVSTVIDLYDMYDELRQDYLSIKKQLASLKLEVRGVAEESSMWTLKYSRRFLITSNILLSSYLLSNRILQILNDHSRSLLSSVMNPFGWLLSSFKSSRGAAAAAVSKKVNGVGVGVGAAAASTGKQIIQNTLGALVERPEILSSYSAFKKQFLRRGRSAHHASSIGVGSMGSGASAVIGGGGGSSVGGLSTGTNTSSIQITIVKLIWRQLVLAGLLLFSSYWVGNARTAWKRKIGIVMSFLTNMHLALTSDVSPWTIYFNMFTLLLYITARHMKNQPLPQALQTIRKSLSMSSFQSSATKSSNFKKMQHKLLKDSGKNKKQLLSSSYQHLHDGEDDDDEHGKFVAQECENYKVINVNYGTSSSTTPTTEKETTVDLSHE